MVNLGSFVIMVSMTVKILEQVPLAPFTTMCVGGSARFFARAESVGDLRDVVLFARERNLPVFMLGGGSNTLVPDEGFPGLVIKVELKGISYVDTLVTTGAGEVWDELVRDVVLRSLWGIENLSLIPGTVGGAAVQNIGAYGVEACDTIHSVEAFDTQTMQVKTFSHDECKFGYRESIFKENKNLIVVRVSLKLMYGGVPHTDYEDVQKYFLERGVSVPTLAEIREAIIAIRTAKMPAPYLGTAGSFFKNPVVEAQQYNELKKRFPGIKAYLQGDGTVKLSAAWLLDKVGGWRGVRRGDAGVHEKQALILVNYGNAGACEIISLAKEMKRDMKEKINIEIEEEVVTM